MVRKLETKSVVFLYLLFFFFVLLSIDNLGLHRVENPSHSDTSVSLHLYCPPFDTCSVFQDNLKKTTAKVTFWSKYGVRTKQNEQ